MDALTPAAVTQAKAMLFQIVDDLREVQDLVEADPELSEAATAAVVTTLAAVDFLIYRSEHLGGEGPVQRTGE